MLVRVPTQSRLRARMLVLVMGVVVAVPMAVVHDAMLVNMGVPLALEQPQRN